MAIWGDGDCIYGKQHAWTKMRDFDTNKKVIACPNCEKRLDEVRKEKSRVALSAERNKQTDNT